VEEALWAYRTAHKLPTRYTPFQLAYGMEAIMPFELEIASLCTVLQHNLSNEESLNARLLAIERLDETKRATMWNIEITQRRRKYYHDKKAPLTLFWPCDLVMLIDSWLMKQHGQKFRPKWKGPFVVHQLYNKGTYKLSTPGGDLIDKRYNGSKLKKYTHRDDLQPSAKPSSTEDWGGYVTAYFFLVISRNS
jgi:hypothetical protein